MRMVPYIEQGAKKELERAESLAVAGGFGVADWELAQHRWRLGCACWKAGRRQQAAALWRQAATVPGPTQVSNPIL